MTYCQPTHRRVTSSESRKLKNCLEIRYGFDGQKQRADGLTASARSEQNKRLRERLTNNRHSKFKETDKYACYRTRPGEKDIGLFKRPVVEILREADIALNLKKLELYLYNEAGERVLVLDVIDELETRDNEWVVDLIDS